MYVEYEFTFSSSSKFLLLGTLDSKLDTQSSAQRTFQKLAFYHSSRFVFIVEIFLPKSKKKIAYDKSTEAVLMTLSLSTIQSSKTVLKFLARVSEAGFHPMS